MSEEVKINTSNAFTTIVATLSVGALVAAIGAYVDVQILKTEIAKTKDEVQKFNTVAADTKKLICYMAIEVIQDKEVTQKLCSINSEVNQ
jgi:hypothetical protein